MQRISLLLACLFFWTNTLAQQYPFVHYTPREGLANNRARFVFQDSKGKLYISTYAGLSIYDGSRFTNYNTNNGLGASLINAIVEMGNDSIWIVPNANRIHCLVNGKLKDFVTEDNYVPIVNRLVKCSDGYYYALADEGLFRIEGSRFRKIQLNWFQQGNDAAGLIACVELHRKLYILSNPGFMSAYGMNLFVYDLKQEKLLAWKRNIKGISLFNYEEKELWLSTVGGMFRADESAIRDTNIILQPLPDSYHVPKNLFPQEIYQDRQRNIWLASQVGIIRIKKNGETTRFTVESGLTTNIQNSIFQDYENNMWFTNEETGLSKLSSQELVFYPEIIQGFNTTDFYIPPNSDSVWLYDGQHRRVLMMLPGKKPEEFVYSGPVPGPKGFISGYNRYMIRGNSILRWETDPAARLFQLLPHYTHADSVKGWEYIYGLADKKDNIFALSEKLMVITDARALKLPLDYFTDQLAIDGSGRIWLASRGNKLSCYEISGPARGKQISLLRAYNKELPTMSPRSITVDGYGDVWIGTRDHGVACIHFDGLNLSSVKLITTRDGLSDNFVTYLYCDSKNNIWACTPSGLDLIRRDGKNLFVENITRRNNFYFPVTKIQQTTGGTSWILSSAGILTFTPSRQPTGNWKPGLEFADIIVSNAKNLAMKPGMELRHFQNNLNLRLSAPTFIDEKQTRFSFMLEGAANDEWSEPSTNASINFVNLPPGDYTLRARAIFLHGLYPDALSSISFTVLPPWWQTWWFRISAAILILVMVLAGLRYYINRKLELQRMTLEKKQAVEKERTRIATDMHDDLGAGLSRIKFLSEIIGMKKQQHLPIEEEIDSIRSYSHEMIDKMGEIVWALNEKNDTLSDLLSYTRAYAAEYLEQNGITCRVEEPENIPPDEVSGEFRRNIFLSVKEALHNIVKHAQATDVSIKIYVSEQLRIQIKDNGIGLDNSGMRKTGNGLFNMRARIEELKGNFEISANGGTLVDIRVPLGV